MIGAGPEGLDSSTVGLQTNCWRVELGQSNSTPQPPGGGGGGGATIQLTVEQLANCLSTNCWKRVDQPNSNPSTVEGFQQLNLFQTLQQLNFFQTLQQLKGFNC